MLPRTSTLLLLTLALAAGCGSSPELGQVDGAVTAGGQPLAGVLVTFVPEASGPAARVRSLAVTDAQGRFHLRTEQQQDGAVLGRHKVTVEDLAIHSAPRSPDGTVLELPHQRFAPRYSDPLQTPLARDVVSGSQTMDLKLD